MKTTMVSETVKVRSGSFGEWVVWVLVDEMWKQYGVYESQERALEYAGYASGKF